MLAVRARNNELSLVCLFVLTLDARRSRNCWRRDNENFSACKGSSSSLSQCNRIAFSFNVTRVAINLIQKQIANRHRAQTHGAVCARHHQNATTELFTQDGVA